MEDPVFLLNRQSWEEISADITPQERYVLVYDFSNDPTIREHARQIARQLGARLYSLNDFAPLAYAERNISDAGPLEFLAWIKNAELVISNSFHAIHSPSFP
ncbi:MAG: polysaccharide pyruvyl transferase family protein [Alistipes onderdonkii]